MNLFMKGWLDGIINLITLVLNFKIYKQYMTHKNPHQKPDQIYNVKSCFFVNSMLIFFYINHE